MQIIGLIGGMSYASTVSYYARINELAIARWGGQSRARVLISSVDFDAIERCQAAGEWARAGELLAAEALRLQAAGAGVIGLCTNTMHKCAPAINAALSSAKFVHIAHAAAAECKRRGIKKLLLLGTRYTMEQGFLRDELGAVEAIVPAEADRALINRVIFEQLCAGVVSDGAREEFARIAQSGAAAGAQAALLGCTEIALLLDGAGVGQGAAMGAGAGQGAAMGAGAGAGQGAAMGAGADFGGLPLLGNLPALDTACIHADALFAAANA